MAHTRSGRPGCPPGPPRQRGRRACRGQSRGSSSAPGPPSARTAGQLPWSLADDQVLGPAEVGRQVQHRGGRLVGQGQGLDPGLVGEPDREVGDDRSGPVQGPADRRHLAVEGLVAGSDARCSAGRRQPRRQAEQDRGGHRQGRAQPGDLLRPAAPGAQPDEQGVQREQAGHDQQDLDRTGGVQERAPGGRDREDQGRDPEGQEGHDQERPERPDPDRSTAVGAGRSGRSGSWARAGRVNRLWAEPVDPHLDQAAQADGQVAGQRRRVVPGEDVEAGHRQRVGQRPGPAADCRRRSSRGPSRARRRRGRRRPAPGSAGSGRPERGGPRPDLAPRTRPGRPRPGPATGPRCGSGPRGRSVTPRPRRRGSRARAPRGSASRRVIRRHAARTRTVKIAVESGSALNRTRGSSTAAVRPAPIARVRARPAGRPSSIGHVGRQPPGQDRHHRPDQHGRHLGHRERRAEDGHRQRGQQRRQGQPDLEGGSRKGERAASGSSRWRRWSGRGPRPGCARPSRSRPCPRASGRAACGQTRRARAGRRRTAGRRCPMPRGVDSDTGHRPASVVARTVQRGSAELKQTG